MANEKDINRLFRNPPKGGNGAGVPTQNPMSPNPRTGIENRGGFFGGGGSNIKQQREEREMSGLSEHEKMKRQMDKWNEPPPPPTGIAAQTSLRDSFEAGEQSSRNHIQQSGRVNQPEMRNFQRNHLVPQEADDPSAQSWYDFEAAQAGTPAGASASGPMPKPTLNPPTPAGRADGKPANPMPKNRDD